MHDNQQFPLMRMPKHNPAVFHLRMGRIGNRQRQGVAEDRRRLLEADAVLLQISPGLVLVPLKVHRHGSILPVYSFGAKRDLPSNLRPFAFRIEAAPWSVGMGRGGRKAEGAGDRQPVWNLYGTCMEFVWNAYGTTRQQHAGDRLRVPGRDGGDQASWRAREPKTRTSRTTGNRRHAARNLERLWPTTPHAKASACSRRRERLGGAWGCRRCRPASFATGQ